MAFAYYEYTFWDEKSCGLIDSKNVSEEFSTSIFRIPFSLNTEVEVS
jgi:hypothetical protein